MFTLKRCTNERIDFLFVVRSGDRLGMVPALNEKQGVRQMTTDDQMTKASFLLGMAWAILREQREMLSHYERNGSGSDSHNEAYARFEEGIEELFYPKESTE